MVNNGDEIMCPGGCGFFGSPATQGKCSQCYNSGIQQQQQNAHSVYPTLAPDGPDGPETPTQTLTPTPAAATTPSVPSSCVDNSGNSDPGAKSVAGLAALGYVCGAIIMGPFVAIAGAVGGVYVASGLAGEGKNVDAARKIGNATADVGRSVFKTVRDADKKYNIIDKTKAAVGQVATAAVDLNNKHQITSQIANGVSQGAAQVSKALEPRTK